MSEMKKILRNLLKLVQALDSAYTDLDTMIYGFAVEERYYALYNREGYKSRIRESLSALKRRRRTTKKKVDAALKRLGVTCENIKADMKKVGVK